MKILTGVLRGFRQRVRFAKPSPLGCMIVLAQLAVAPFTLVMHGQSPEPTSAATPASPQLVWIDTDIGDDIDDAFALGLILRSPELRVLGISTAFGDTETRARLVDRFLAATGATGIPVTAGIHTETDNPLTQRAYAEQFPARKHADGVTALLAAIRQHPGQVTLIAIGPLFNVGAAIDRDRHSRSSSASS
jgi:purine nucleosidase